VDIFSYYTGVIIFWIWEVKMCREEIALITSVNAYLYYKSDLIVICDLSPPERCILQCPD